jgi:hypothetical protein
MDKRKRLLVSLYVLCLSVCTCLLAGCNSQTPSLPATPSSLVLTQTSISEAQVTPDVIFNLVGTYAGTYQWHGNSSPAQLRLEITEQNSIQLSGSCTLGDQSYPLKEALVGTAFGGEQAVMMFTVDVPANQGQQPVSLIFSGSVTKEGTMSGDVNASDGRTGTWSAKKA